MNAVLLDTDVFSFLMKEGDTRSALYRPHINGKAIVLSFVTVGELYVWTIRRRWNARRLAAFEQRLKAAVIVPYDLDLCKTYGKLRAALLDKGRPIAANDLWIAASAVRHSIPLITHNSSHSASIRGLKVITESHKPPSPIASS
jgi:tRNA(fMet)-specific endonuclease VapC